MKKFVSIFAIVALLFVASACGNRAQKNEAVEEPTEMVDSVAVDSTAVEVLEVAE